MVTKCFWVELEVLAILVGVVTSFNPFKGGGGGKERFYPVLRWLGCKKLWTRDFPILCLPSTRY